MNYLVLVGHKMTKSRAKINESIYKKSNDTELQLEIFSEDEL